MPPVTLEEPHKKLFESLMSSDKEKTAADAISAWTRAQIRGDYGNYPFTGGKIRGITRTLFDPVFYEILEQRLTREDRARRFELRLVGRKEWYEYSHDLRWHKHNGWNTEEFERPWFEAFGELSATILRVADVKEREGTRPATSEGAPGGPGE